MRFSNVLDIIIISVSSFTATTLWIRIWHQTICKVDLISITKLFKMINRRNIVFLLIHFVFLFALCAASVPSCSVSCLMCCECFSLFHFLSHVLGVFLFVLFSDSCAACSFLFCFLSHVLRVLLFVLFSVLCAGSVPFCSVFYLMCC